MKFKKKKQTAKNPTNKTQHLIFRKAFHHVNGYAVLSVIITKDPVLLLFSLH